MSGRAVALGLLAVELAALGAMGWWPGAAGLPAPALGLWAVSFLAYTLAASRAETLSRRELWAGGIAARLGLLPLAPALSEDLYRYMWDGWVQRNGLNPYGRPPGAEELAPLRTEWWPEINHPDVPTIYPPGAQLVFLALAWAGPARWVFKLAWLAADLGVARLIERLASAEGRADPRRATSGGAASSRGDPGRTALLLYLFSPLVLVEVAWSGHLEPLGILLMLLAVALAGAAGPWRAGLALGLGASVKFAPLAGAPALWRRVGPGPAALALALPLLLYLPYAAAGKGLFQGLGTYADIWEFNGGVFRILALLPGPADLPRWLAAAVPLAVVGAATLRGRSLERTLFAAIGAALIVSPTLHPWYLLWVLPFACLRASRGWILYTGTVFLAYAGREAYLATGAWPEPGWLVALIHAPPLAWLARDGWRGRAQRLRGRGQITDREEGGEGDRRGHPEAG